MISDGTTDCSYQEAKIVIVRSCNKGKVNVHFSLVKNVPKGDSQTICRGLVDGLEICVHTSDLNWLEQAQVVQVRCLQSSCELFRY